MAAAADTAAHEGARHVDAAWIAVVLAGIVAAMHIWKLPGAVTLIQAELGMTLVQAGVLLGLVQVGGMLGGLAISLSAELLGMRRCLLIGMGLLIAGTAVGALAPDVPVLMVGRFIEGAGFLAATVVAPALIRRSTPAWRINTAMGFWASFQGFATFIAVTASALVLQVADWRPWYWAMAVLTLVPLPLLLHHVPPDPPRHSSGTRGAVRRIAATTRSWKPWIAGIVFGCYTIQWMAIIGFLPTIYAQNGVGGLQAGFLSAVAGGVNAIGAILAGWLLQRGASVRRLVIPTFVAMGTMAVLTFAVDWSAVPGGFALQFACVVLFSSLGALVPASLTRLAVDLAPEGGSAPAVLGLMQQIYTAGSFAGPAIVAWLATSTGGWQSTWWMNATFCALGIALALLLSERRLGLRLRHG